MFQHDWAGADEWNKTVCDSIEIRVFRNQQSVDSEWSEAAPNTSNQEPSLMQKTTYPNADGNTVKSSSPAKGQVTYLTTLVLMVVLAGHLFWTDFCRHP